MKKLFLILFVIGIVNKSEALVIQNVTISNSNVNDINIKVNVVEGNVIEFHSSNYAINGSIINLNICYTPFILSAVTYLENNFIIPDINNSTNIYTLIVTTYTRRSVNNVWSCTNLLNSDNETIQFSTPVTNAVSLGNTSFINLEQKINLIPNPATTTFEIKNSNNLQSISIYDNLGRSVKEFLKPENNYDISDLNSGIYYVKIKDSNGAVFDEKLIKK
jgi:hypothetical protein